METTKHGWKILDRDAGVLLREYSFMPGAVATTLVFRGRGDGLVVVSPSSRTDPLALDELSEHGKVVALVANNAMHHLGQPEWRARFPEARSFAPANAIARISKKHPTLPAFEPLEAAATLLGEAATIVDAPGFKAGNAFVTVRGARGTYWYPSDLIANIDALPSNLVFRLAMSLTDSAPGYKLFRPAVWLQVGDKPRVRAFVEQALGALATPLTVVPAHGAPVSGDDLVARTRALAETI